MGDLVRDKMTEAGWNIAETAERLGCERGTLSRLLNGRSGVSANMALALEEVGWGRAKDWMSWQNAYDLAQAHRKRAAGATSR